MSKHQLSNGVEVWYHDSVGQTVQQVESILGSTPRYLNRDLPAVYTIRDSGRGHVVQQVESPGPVLYTISSDHEGLLKALISKSSNPAANVRRYAALWEHEEFLNDAIIDTYVAYIKKSQRYVIDHQNEGFNKENYRYRLFLDEGYRRYGGSARLVLKFITYAANKLASQTFDSVENSLQVVKELPDEQ